MYNRLNLNSVLIIFAAALSLIISGCGAATVEKKMTRLRFADNIVVSYPQNGFDAYPDMVQQVVFEQDNTTYEFTAMVELKKASMTIAGLSPLGDRQFLMTLDGNEFRYESQMMFDLPFPPQYLARDFLLIYTSPGALEQQLKGLKVYETVNGRGIKYNNVQHIEIERDMQGFAASEIRFVNLIAGYSIQISTVQVDYPNEVSTPGNTTP